MYNKTISKFFLQTKVNFLKFFINVILSTGFVKVANETNFGVVFMQFSYPNINVKFFCRKPNYY